MKSKLSTNPNEKYEKMKIEKVSPMERVRLIKNMVTGMQYMRKKKACVRGIPKSHTRADHRLRTCQFGTRHHNAFLLFSLPLDQSSKNTNFRFLDHSGNQMKPIRDTDNVQYNVEV
jgi:hypothetical protein